MNFDLSSPTRGFPPCDYGPAGFTGRRSPLTFPLLGSQSRPSRRGRYRSGNVAHKGASPEVRLSLLTSFLCTGGRREIACPYRSAR